MSGEIRLDRRRERSSRAAPAAAATLLCCALVAGLAFPAAGPAVTPVGSRAITVDLLGASQQQILDAGSIRARVRAKRRGFVTAVARLRSQDAGSAGRPAPISKPVSVRFRKRGRKVLRLRLTPAGRSLVASCGSQSLDVVAKLKRSSGASRFADRLDITRDGAGCRAPSSVGGGVAGGAAGGGGDSPGSELGSDEPPGGTSPGPQITAADRCDWLDPATCLYPWPNDFFTVADSGMPTGRRVNLSLLSTPRNTLLIPLIPTEHNRSDGFSPGNMMITKVPGLDNQQAFDNTGAVPITDIERYADPEQPIVVINVETGERQPIWAEVDANPPTDAERSLIIRPARNFDEGGHYIVALRNLKDAAGNTIEPGLGFKVYRDRLITPQAAIEERRPHMERIFESLQSAGIRRMDLNLAWDFTVASQSNVTGRARHIRDTAFAELGDPNLADGQIQGASPYFAITNVEEFTEAQDPNIFRRVRGVVRIPCFLNLPGCISGSNFLILPGSDNPVRLPLNSIDAPFRCEIPRSAAAGDTAQPARVSLYGHGLLGSHDEVGAGNVKAMANEHNMIFCATDWIGFSSGDLASVLLILQDINNFPKLVDRTQQGFLNFMFLGRAMIHSNGFGTSDAFKFRGQSMIDDSDLFYDGNSQGGILGGALTALAPDFERASLGVPAMNYSTLLRRSSDFAPYAEGQFTEQLCDIGVPPEVCELLPDDTPLGLWDNYPNQLERPLVLSLMQMLWDRGEPNGYAHHMTDDPLPNTPPHKVLMQPAFADHQVANVAADVEARTIGASVYRPVAYPGRSPDVTPAFGIPSIPSFPFDGSAIVYWDGGPQEFPGGTAPAPTTNTPPGISLGNDPHSYPRGDIKARAQKSDFLQVGGALSNYCVSENLGVTDPAALVSGPIDIPCFSHGFGGP